LGLFLTAKRPAPRHHALIDPGAASRGPRTEQGRTVTGFELAAKRFVITEVELNRMVAHLRAMP